MESYGIYSYSRMVYKPFYNQGTPPCILRAVGPCADLCLQSHAGQGMDLLPGALEKGRQYGSHDGYKELDG